MRVLAVDDHSVYLGALNSILEERFEALEFEQLKSVDLIPGDGNAISDFDLIIIDLSYRGKDNTRGVCSFIDANPNVKILVLSNYEDGRHIRAVSDAGARGYLPKSSSAEILTSVVQLVAAGGRYFPHDDGDDGGLGLGTIGQSNQIDEVTLTPRQLEILEQLAMGATISELADSLGMSEPTIKADIAKAIRALNARNRLNAVCLAMEAGLINPDLS